MRQRKKRRIGATKRACELCRIKHVKCDGETPCGRCRNRKMTCYYSEPKKRGPTKGQRENTKAELQEVTQELERQKKEVARWKRLYENATQAKTDLWTLSCHFGLSSSIASYLVLYRETVRPWRSFISTNWTPVRVLDNLKTNETWMVDPSMLEILGCLACGARMSGSKEHADAFVNMARQIVRNLFDTKSIAVTCGTYNIGIYERAFGDGTTGRYYMEIATSMAKRVSQDKKLKCSPDMWRVDSLIRSYKFQNELVFPPNREALVKAYNIVIENLTACTLERRNIERVEEVETLQKLWAMIGVVFVSLGDMPWYACIWGKEKASVVNLTPAQYKICMSQLDLAVEVLKTELSNTTPLTRFILSTMIKAARALVTLSISADNMALQIAWSAWRDYKSRSSSLYIQISVCILTICCTVAIKNSDNKLFSEAFNGMLSTAAMWNSHYIYVSHIYDRATDAGLNTTQFENIIADIRQNYPTTLGEIIRESMTGTGTKELLTLQSGVLDKAETPRQYSPRIEERSPDSQQSCVEHDIDFDQVDGNSSLPLPFGDDMWSDLDVNDFVI
mmetsp:Transcript_16032/g.17802  ORF Transcript_16032/g.17802 Transcript_16032/m.17802 type:complete len:563 (-) Transcript_16032:36-1724(-)